MPILYFSKKIWQGKPRKAIIQLFTALPNAVGVHRGLHFFFERYYLFVCLREPESTHEPVSGRRGRGRELISNRLHTERRA